MCILSIIVLNVVVLELKTLSTECKSCFILQLIEQTNIQQETTFLNMRAHMGRTLSFFFSTMAQLRKYEVKKL